MFVGYTSNHEDGCYRMRNPNTQKVSKTRDMVFLNRIFFKTPTLLVKKKQNNDDEDLNSVQQDKRGGTITAHFVTNDNNAAAVESMDSSVPDTPVVNNNLKKSKYGRMYRRTMHYDPTKGHTISTEATALANYYKCLEDTNGKMEFANVGAGIGEGFENTMELKLSTGKPLVDQMERSGRKKLRMNMTSW
jgi:hypothetical protein